MGEASEGSRGCVDSLVLPSISRLILIFFSFGSSTSSSSSSTSSAAEATLFSNSASVAKRKNVRLMFALRRRVSAFTLLSYDAVEAQTEKEADCTRGATMNAVSSLLVCMRASGERAAERSASWVPRKTHLFAFH